MRHALLKMSLVAAGCGEHLPLPMLCTILPLPLVDATICPAMLPLPMRHVLLKMSLAKAGAEAHAEAEVEAKVEQSDSELRYIESAFV